MFTTRIDQLANPSNPFCTRRVRPGAIAFRFSGSENVHRIIQRLWENQWFGQIVGPHGSGKSTLLRTLDAAWHDVSRSPTTIQLRDGQCRLPVSRQHISSWDRSTQVIVDGYEQLALTARWRLRRWCRLRGCGLLVTCHRPTRLPVVYRTEISTETTRQLVAQLVADTPYLVSPEEIDRCFWQCKGNVRETFFALYDVVQSKLVR